VNLAKTHKDALDEKGRRDEMQHLREAVSEKLRALGVESPDVLKSPDDLVGILRDEEA
jgi:hypothetical protein